MNVLIAIMMCVFVFLHSFQTSRAQFRLMLIHNNDMHSRFEETNAYGGPCKGSRCYGGFARMKTAIEMAKEEARKDGVPHLVMNSGDTFQGSPYFDEMKRHIVQPLIESLSIDVMTLGNHEFDVGVDHLSEYIRQVQIPIVCCNINLTTTPQLDVPNLKPSIILNVNGTKVGVVGFLTRERNLLPSTVHVLDEIASVQAEAIRLKQMGVEIIVGLGHSGFDREVEVAREVPELSVVIGGHSHTLLYSPKDKPPSMLHPKESYPFMVTQKSGKKVPYVQAGWATGYLGKLTLVFDDNGNVLSATGNTQLLDSSIPEDAEVKKLVGQHTVSLRPTLKVVKGYTRVPLLAVNLQNRQYESNLANFVVDVMANAGVRKDKNNITENWTSASIAFMNAAGIRAEVQNPGPITLEDVIMTIPFRNEIYLVQYTGSTLRKALEHSVESDTDPIAHYIHFSGMRVTYDLTRSVGNRVVDVHILCSNCSIPRYEVLQDDMTYSVLINDYILDGGSGFTMFREEKKNTVKLGFTAMDAVLEYLEREQIVYPGLDGRVTVRDHTHS